MMEREKLFEVDPYGFLPKKKNTATTTTNTNAKANAKANNSNSNSNSNSHNGSDTFQRDNPLLSSADSLPTTSQASYSVPGSRRNSTDGDDDAAITEAFNTKLNLYQQQPQNSLGFLTAPHRSMSIDEAAMKQKLTVGTKAAEAADPHGTQRLLFDNDAGRIAQIW
jgi:hypothetical protein